MCAKFENVPHKHRARTSMPNGQDGSLVELEQRFAHVPHDERGRVSREVMQIIPRREMFVLTDWIQRKTNARPIPQALIELFVFYALAFVTAVGKTIHDTVAMIRDRRSVVGVILPA